MRLYHFLPLLFSPVLLMAESAITDAFEQGAVHGQIKLFSYDIDKASDEDAYANAVGGYLKYSTDTKQSLYASVRFHTSQPVGHGQNREDTSLFNDNGDALTANSEAFIGWNGRSRT